MAWWEIRELLLRTAERLYGERGLNGVSLREIGREAGQRNVSAVCAITLDRAKA